MRLPRTGLAALAACAACAAPSLAAAAEPVTKTPIRHFVTLMQENHSFDNYFGTYPGADGIPRGTCMLVDVDRPKGACVKPGHIGNRAVEDLKHSSEIFRLQYRGGRMDGFVDAFRRSDGEHRPITMGHYDDRDIPYYWNVADEYVLFDRFFTSASAGSVANHMYWVTGGSGNQKGESIPLEGFDEQTTIFDRLEEKGVSWKFYVENYDPAITFRAKTLGDRGSQVVWVPLLNYARYVDDERLFSKIVPLEEYYEDLRRGTLPAVSYIVPSGSSEHPPGSLRAGETFVRSLVDGLVRSRYWTSSAFMWTYDDWGGWYDHVKPPRVDRHGYGFRAPALLVSSWARRGHIESTTMDFTSILKFIEENWDIQPLASRDRRAKSLMPAFDFRAGPRAAAFLGRERNVKALKEPRRWAVYVTYTLAVVVAAAFMAAAFVGPTRRRRRLEGPAAGIYVVPEPSREEPGQ